MLIIFVSDGHAIESRDRVTEIEAVLAQVRAALAFVPCETRIRHYELYIQSRPVARNWSRPVCGRKASVSGATAAKPAGFLAVSYRFSQCRPMSATWPSPSRSLTLRRWPGPLPPLARKSSRGRWPSICRAAAGVVSADPAPWVLISAAHGAGEAGFSITADRYC